jgi:hypothetical protein
MNLYEKIKKRNYQLWVLAMLVCFIIGSINNVGGNSFEFILL